MKIKLSDIAQFVADRVSSSNILLQEYVTTDSILPNKQGRIMAQNMPPQTCSLTKFEKGDVLVSNIRPYLKKIWLADCAGGASTDVLVFRAKNNFSNQYLYAVLAQDAFYDWVMLGTKGSRMPRGNREQIMRFPISALCEQEALYIGTLIENINNKINLNRQINQNLEALARQLYDYWFVQFDFPDANGKPYKSNGGKMVWNDQLKREIPEGWKVCKLQCFITFFDSQRIPLSSQDREKRKGCYPYYGATGIMDYVNEYIFDGDYILLAEDGSTSDINGYPIVQYIWGKSWVNNHAHIIQPQNNRYTMFTYQMLRYIPAIQIETGSIQKKISQENLGNYNMALPQSELMEKYVWCPKIG